MLDSRGLRRRTILAQLILGLVLTPVFGIGLLFAAPSLLMALKLAAANRHAMFYGPDPAAAQGLERREVVRI